MRSRTAKWFICKIRYEKVNEDGLQKKVTEIYVVDALSFSEAEARITEEMQSYISGQFDILKLIRPRLLKYSFLMKRQPIGGTKPNWNLSLSTKRQKRRNVVQLHTWCKPGVLTRP